MKLKKLSAAGFKITAAECLSVSPFLHILLGISLFGTAVFRQLKHNTAAMDWIVLKIARPYHSIAGALSSAVPFSLAELFYTAAALGAAFYIIRAVYIIIRSRTKLRHLYKALLTMACFGMSLYFLLCLLWNSLYYSRSFQDVNNIEGSSVSTEKLSAVAYWFAQLANTYAEDVSRDGNGLYIIDENQVLNDSALLYADIEKQYESLGGKSSRVKPMFFSELFSRMNFTGFFFPLTGEANINTSSPACMRPCTIAHEMAHQRGISREQEANFIAVMVCLKSGSPDYKYSASLTAYQYLANALYRADRDSWAQLVRTLDAKPKLDLKINSEYWQQYKSPVSAASEAIYDGYLNSQSQSLGIKSYGACVNLLGNFYYENAVDGYIP